MDSWEKLDKINKEIIELNIKLNELKEERKTITLGED